MNFLGGHILAYIGDNFVIKASTNGWYNTDCFFCGRRGKFCIHPGFGRVKCWVCGYSNGFINFLAGQLNLSFKETFKLLQNYRLESYDFVSNFTFTRPLKESVSISLPNGYRNILDGSGHLADLARNYLLGRGFCLDYLSRLGIGYCVEKHDDPKLNYFGYIIIPFSRAGIYYYFIARNYMNNFLRYKNPSVESLGIGKGSLLWNNDALLLYDKIWVMEGVFSALTIGDAAVATLGKSVSRTQVEMLLKSICKEVVIAFDPNTFSESVSLASQLISYKKVKILNLEQGDPNELGEGKLIEIEKNTPYLTYGNLLGLIKTKI